MRGEARETLVLLPGCGFGLWAIAWWLEPDGGVAAPLAFAAYALASSLLLMLACWLHERSAPFQPSRQAEIGAALGLPIALANVAGYVISGQGVQNLPPHSFGYIWLPALAVIATCSVLTAPLGARSVVPGRVAMNP